jgi:hypothetical protein
MHSTFHLKEMSISSLRRLFCDMALPILSILDSSQDEAVREPPTFSEEIYPCSEPPASLFKTRKDIFRKGCVHLCVTFSESYFKDAEDEATGGRPAPVLRGMTLSLYASIIEEGKKDWLINTELISADGPDQLVRKFPLVGCSRAITGEKWEKLLAFVNSLGVIVPADTVLAKVFKEDGTVAYNEDIVRSHIEAEFSWAHTREGSDGVMASGGRLYWYDQYAGIRGDESYEDFLRRFNAEEKLYGTLGEVPDGRDILLQIRAHILENHPELSELSQVGPDSLNPVTGKL